MSEKVEKAIKLNDCFVVTENDGSFHVYKDKACTILHNPNGPACRNSTGDYLYYIDGKRHRINGPAVEYANGEFTYYQNGILHRADGPAHKSGQALFWYQNGVLHREEGPAIEYTENGDYYLDGIWYTESRWRSRMKDKEVESVATRESNRIVYKNKVGQYHRLDGPAVVYDSGTQYWYKQGQLHCPTGPAISHASGTQEYYSEGMRHRPDGPAYIMKAAPGIRARTEYWRNGRKYTKNDYIAKFQTPVAPAPVKKQASLQELFGQARLKVASKDYSDKYMSSEKCATPYMTSYIAEAKPKKQSLQEKLRKNLEEGSYMALGDKAIKKMKEAIINRFEETTPDKAAMVRSILEMPGSTEVLAMMFGIGLDFVPKYGENERLQKVADCLRTSAIQGGTSIILDAILPATESLLSQLPDLDEAPKAKKRVARKARVLAPKAEVFEEEEESEQEKIEARL